MLITGWYVHLYLSIMFIFHADHSLTCPPIRLPRIHVYRNDSLLITVSPVHTFVSCIIQCFHADNGLSFLTIFPLSVRVIPCWFVYPLILRVFPPILLSAMCTHSTAILPFLSVLPTRMSFEWFLEIHCLPCVPTYHSVTVWPVYQQFPSSHYIYFTVCPVYPLITPNTICLPAGSCELFDILYCLPCLPTDHSSFCLICLPTVSSESLHWFYSLPCLPTYHSSSIYLVCQ